MFLRVLIPSWRFFDDIGPAPMLEYRIKNEDPWALVLKGKETRNWTHLFFNPARNLRFACHSLIERLVHDIENKEDASVSKELVENLIRHEIQSISKFQWRVRIDEETIFLSEVSQ